MESFDGEIGARTVIPSGESPSEYWKKRASNSSTMTGPASGTCARADECALHSQGVGRVLSNFRATLFFAFPSRPH